MNAETDVPTVIFPPTERHSVFLDLTLGQVLVLGPAASLAFGAVYILQNLASVLFAVTVVTLAVTAAFLHVRIGTTRRTAVEWAPIAGTWVWESLPTGAGVRRHVRALPSRIRPETGGVVDPFPAPGAGPLRGISIWPGVLSDGSPFGAVLDRPAGRWLALVEVRGRHVAMVDNPEMLTLQRKWGALVNGLGRQSATVSRTAWSASSGPVDELAATWWLRTHAVVGSDDPSVRAQEELIAGGGHAAPEHRLVIVLAIDPNRAKRMIAVQGGGRDGAVKVLADEVERFQGSLKGAGLTVVGVLDQRAVAATLRLAFDPPEAEKLAVLTEGGSPGLSPTAAGPQFWDVHLDYLVTSTTFHIAGVVDEWPGAEMPVDFLVPLLEDPSIQRRITQVLVPLSPLQAMSYVGTKLHDVEVQKQVRERWGFLAGRAKHERQEDAAREEDRAIARSGVNREATVLVVSAPTLEKAEAAWAQLELAAAGSFIRLERATGMQEDVFLASLPLCRGLR